MKPCASGPASSARASPTRSDAGCPVLATSGTWTVCHEHISRAKEVWRCTRDEGRPLEVRSQVPASNPCKLRSSRAIVVSVAAKGGRHSRQVRSGEASESELLMTCRNAKDDVKTGGASSFRDQFGGCPEDRPSDIRHVGGAKPDQALVWNVRTCRPDAKGDVQAAQTARIRVPMRGTGAEGLQCSAATQSQPVAGGALWPRQSRFPSRMGMAEHREPYDARVSRTVLGARGGETPPRDSPSVSDDQRPEALALAGRRPGWLRARRSRPEPARQEGRQAPAPQAAEAAVPGPSCDDHGQAGQLRRRQG